MEQILHARARTTNSIYKDATVNKYHYESKAQLQIHLQTFIDAYNHVKQLKALKRLTPWELNPLMFGFDPAYYNMGPHKR